MTLPDKLAKGAAAAKYAVAAKVAWDVFDYLNESHLENRNNPTDDYTDSFENHGRINTEGGEIEMEYSEEDDQEILDGLNDLYEGMKRDATAKDAHRDDLEELIGSYRAAVNDSDVTEEQLEAYRNTAIEVIEETTRFLEGDADEIGDMTEMVRDALDYEGGDTYVPDFDEELERISHLVDERYGFEEETTEE